KPFAPRELIARISALLRRSRSVADGAQFEAEGLQLDGESMRLYIGGEPVHIGPTEFKLLRFFMSHPDRVYSRGQLLDQVWGGNVYLEERTVDVHIRRLRQALQTEFSDRSHFIQTVRGAGYRFSANAQGMR
ncbi:MAG: winged helix-turn-helix domain-containing protein, partial [Halioglobus sp.]